jgi:hypothetical protein
MSGSGRFWVELALVCYLLGFGYSVYSLATNRFLTTRITLLAICAGFLFTTIFLFDRGHAIGRCPITNRFDVLVFMTWSIVLIYLVIGSTYRLSLMGAFTAPVASTLLISGDLTFAGRGGGQKNQGQSVDRGTHLVLDGRLRCVCLGMHRRCHVPDSGAAIEDSATKLDLFSASADRSAVGRKFSSAMVGFHPVHGRYHHRVSDWPTR